jgi:hypothetical protein
MDFSGKLPKLGELVAIGGTRMPYYRIFFSNKGSIGCFDEFQAEDDVSAMREAVRHLSAEESGELYCGERRVTAVRGKPSERASA